MTRTKTDSLLVNCAVLLCIIFFDAGQARSAPEQTPDGQAQNVQEVGWSTDILTSLTGESLSAEFAKLLADGKVETMTIQPSATPWWIPPHVPPGDPEYKGNGPIVTTHVYLDIRNGSQIYAVVDFKAIEDRPDWTNAQGRASFLVWKEPSGRELLGIAPPYDGRAAYKDSNHATDVVAGSGVMRQLIAYGDGSGNDAGVHTGCSVTFHPVTVIVRKNR